MAVTNEKVDSVRLNRFEMKRLMWVLVFSLLVHLLGWGGYELGKKTGLWQKLHWTPRQQLAQKKNPPPVVQDSDPSIFLDVDPDQATPDAPKDAKYYSAKNSQAANPDANKDLNQPKLDGKQKDVPKTKDVPRAPNAKPQPPQPAPQPKKEEQPAQPKPVQQVGDTKLAKLETSPEKTEEKPERPRTLRQAYAQQSSPRPSKSMQQDGGTRRRALVAAFDSKATAFGDYDAQMFGAIEQYWNDQLYSQKFAQDRSGRVTVRYRLHADGSISDLEMLNNEVGDLLGYVCQQAVAVPAPFAKWPSDMRRMVGDNYRQITLTFIYY